MNTTTILRNAHTQSKTKTGSFLSRNMLGMCLGLIVLATAAVLLFNLSFSTVVFAGILLACPLMHIWMMKDGGHKH